MKKYKSKLKDGRAIYIPNWPVDVALENLTQAGKYLGTNNVINIATLKSDGLVNVPAVIVTIMGCEDPKMVTQLIKHFICQARIDGNRIEPETLNNMFEGDLHSVSELFAHVMHSQYSDFFELGLVEELSQDK